MSNFLKKWASESTENQKLVAEEELILEATEQIWAQLEKLDISKKILAEKLGKSKAFVSQILNGNRNMTLRTLADIGFVLDMKPRFAFSSTKLCCDWHNSEPLAIGHRVFFTHNDDFIEPGDQEWTAGSVIRSRNAA
jgi:transcriptional regulator with XRE-family HTH domain